MTDPLQRHQEHGGFSMSVATVGITRVVEVVADELFPHGVMSVDAGEVIVEVCNICLYTVTTCMHTKNTWHDDGTRLLCDVCGADGT